MGVEFNYIQDVDLLSDWCDSQRSQNIVAIDTEFERRNTYFPELCLIQLATSTGIACVDPLLCDDLRPLVHFLNHPERTKVMHAARQDLEVLELFNVKVGGSLIDTQIAAVIVGEGDQIGYGELTKKITSVELNKNQQLADWKRRPLSSQQQQYAVDDVRYLLPIYFFLLKRMRN
jgi:Ribonuclease D